MPHPELIFLHSESADGCNATRQSSDRLHKQIPDRRRCDRVPEALAICGGDAIAALRMTLIANAFPEAEIDRLSAAVSSGFARGKGKARRSKEGRRGQPPDGWSGA